MPFYYLFYVLNEYHHEICFIIFSNSCSFNVCLNELTPNAAQTTLVLTYPKHKSFLSNDGESEA